MGVVTSAGPRWTQIGLNNLVQFNRKFNSIQLIQPPAVAKTSRPSWSSYERDWELYHGTELCADELIREQRRFLKLWSFRENYSQFRQLAFACQGFFKELTLGGRQSILGAQANLKPWDPRGRCCQRVEFEPPKLPLDVAETFDEYQESFEIPHCLGARLIWWLAAWTAPTAFGYSKTCLQDIFLQPLWYSITQCAPQAIRPFDEIDYECTVDVRPIELIRAAAALCASAPISPTAESGNILQIDDRPMYGMADDRNFYWNDEELTFGPKQGPLVKMALDSHKKRKKVPRHILEKNVWKGEVTGDSNISGHLSKINKQFTDRSIPLVLHFSQNSLSLEYVGPDPNPLI